jgi:hypothetical protein
MNKANYVVIHFSPEWVYGSDAATAVQGAGTGSLDSGGRLGRNSSTVIIK